jgi:hypothetical protein
VGGGTTGTGGAIDAGALALIAPSGGEILYHDNERTNITWSGTASGNVEIAYSTDGGNTYQTIDVVPAQDGVYVWGIPKIDCSTCRIRIVSTSGQGSDSSGNFYILAGWSAIQTSGQWNDGIALATLNDGYVYYLGGGYADEAYGASAIFLSYNIAQDYWTSLSPMLYQRRMLSAAILNGEIYAIGGGQYEGNTPISNVEKWSPSDGIWKVVGGLNTARSRAGAAVLNGKIYLLGGFDGTSSLVSIEIYDPTADKWRYSTDAVPKSFGGMAAASLGGKIYLLGSNGTFQNPSLWVYDPSAVSNLRWRQLATPPVTATILGALVPNLAVVGQFLTYIPDTMYSDPTFVLVYDTQAGVWRTLHPSPSDSHSDGASIGIGDYLYAIGGYTYGSEAEHARITFAGVLP